jgi:hypothetical protein
MYTRFVTAGRDLRERTGAEDLGPASWERLRRPLFEKV